MKWYVIPALITCGLNSMLASIVLCLAVFHLLTDKSTNAPIEPNEEWISLVKWLSVFSTFWLILSVAGMYVSMTKRQTWRLTVVLLLYTLSFGISVYFNVSFGNQLDMKEVGSDILFKTTVVEIANNKGVDTWIPGWLDNIQKQSKICCGIMTYRDYEEFWPNTPSRIPRSCCKDTKTLPSPCPSDLNLIPFPNTPGDFVKVEMGCMQEILEAVRQHIRESYQNSVAMTIFVACGIVAYLVLYTKRYLEGVDDAQQQKQNVQGGGDGSDFEVSNRNQNAILNTGSGPIIISSSGQMGGSIDSFEGIPAFGAMDVFPVQGSGGFPVRQYISDQAQLQMQYRQQQLAAQMQQQPNLQQFQGQQPSPSQIPLPILQQQQAFQALQMQQLAQQWQMSQQTQQQMQQPSGPMLNKGNVAITGLQQQNQQKQNQNQQQSQLQQRQIEQLQLQQRLNEQLQQQRLNEQLQQRQNEQLQQQSQNQQFQLQNQNPQFQQQKPLQQQQQQPAPPFIDTSTMNDNLGSIADGGSASQREAYGTISGAGKPTDREQSNQIPNMGRNFMQPLLPMGNPDIVGNDSNVARTEQQQQTQDAPVISPPGSPTGRRKKVRKEALANRNSK